VLTEEGFITKLEVPAFEAARPPLGRALPSRSLTVAFVNNLPHSALERTERQFAALLSAAAGGAKLCWYRYTLLKGGEVPLAYRRIEDLWQSRPDAVVVTGAEPAANCLEDEPLWRPLVRLLDWAEETGTSMLLSCLAAHAAVQHFDGIRRRRLDRKRFGVFRHKVAGCAAAVVRVAHSRWNELREDELAACGYRILSSSPAAGVDMFTTPRGPLLFCQGHPEYEPETLLREFRRDVRRYLDGVRQTFPEAPLGCIDSIGLDLVARFRRDAETARESRLISGFPYGYLSARLDSSWHLEAAGLVRDWIARALEKRGAPAPQ
jgi:homoserine O-succinyltransferase